MVLNGLGLIPIRLTSPTPIIQSAWLSILYLMIIGTVSAFALSVWPIARRGWRPAWVVASVAFVFSVADAWVRTQGRGPFFLLVAVWAVSYLLVAFVAHALARRTVLKRLGEG